MTKDDIHTSKKALCSTKELELAWNKSQHPNNNNFYNRYIRNQSKNKQYKIVDMGTYCIKNDISPDLLRVFVENGKRILDVLAGNGTDISKDHNKVVVMSEEEYETYEVFKKIQAYNEAHK